MAKMSRKNKTTLFIVAGTLLLALLAGMVLNLYGVFDPKELNPENIVGINTIGEDHYPVSKEGNNGYGVRIDVDEEGAIKVKGTATDDIVFVICENITLEDGQKYRLTAGLDAEDVTYKCIVRLHNVNAVQGSADEFIYADLDGAFVADGNTTYNLEIYIAEDTRVDEIFRPVLVKGTAAGSFYAD